MDLGLKDKNALVTGGSRGLGLASAISLAKEGVNIIICARSEEDLSKAKSIIEKYNVKVYATKLDLANEDSIENLYNQSICLLYTSPSPRDGLLSRMPSSA